MSDDQSGDQTEAELERTRRVVAAAMAEQIATNAAAASVTPEAGAAEVPGAAAAEVPKGNASRDEWAAYATARGHDIDDEWSRDDIRDLFAEEN
jgi:hypothetical protein